MCLVPCFASNSFFLCVSFLAFPEAYLLRISAQRAKESTSLQAAETDDPVSHPAGDHNGDDTVESIASCSPVPLQDNSGCALSDVDDVLDVDDIVDEDDEEVCFLCVSSRITPSSCPLLLLFVFR
jgi:hypothetical protein